MLLLAGKHGLQRLVLKGIADFFEERNKNAEVEDEKDDDEEEESGQIETRDLRHDSTRRNNVNDPESARAAQLQRAQGTVLMHVATAMRHSRQLSQEIIKYLKNLVLETDIILAAERPPQIICPLVRLTICL